MVSARIVLGLSFVFLLGSVSKADGAIILVPTSVLQAVCVTESAAADLDGDAERREEASRALDESGERRPDARERVAAGDARRARRGRARARTPHAALGERAAHERRVH